MERHVHFGVAPIIYVYVGLREFMLTEKYFSLSAGKSVAAEDNSAIRESLAFPFRLFAKAKVHGDERAPKVSIFFQTGQE
jgi:hypothetical protein